MSAAPTALSASTLAAVLDLARCLYGLRILRPCTKREAVAWLLADTPDAAPALEGALALRRDPTDRRALKAVQEAIPAFTQLAAPAPRT